MRKITTLYVLLLSIVFLSCKDNAASKVNETNLESAKERDATIDFGQVTEGDLVEGSFKVTNKGKVDLIITSAKATCGCTVPEWPKEAINPGETGEIKFTFNSNGRLGKQSKSITLQTNSEKVTETVRITGMVVKKS
jgi:hypothetical protein